MHPLSCNPPLFHCSRYRCKKFLIYSFFGPASRHLSPLPPPSIISQSNLGLLYRLQRRGILLLFFLILFIPKRDRKWKIRCLASQSIGEKSGREENSLGGRRPFEFREKTDLLFPPIRNPTKAASDAENGSFCAAARQKEEEGKPTGNPSLPIPRRGENLETPCPHTLSLSSCHENEARIFSSPPLLLLLRATVFVPPPSCPCFLTFPLFLSSAVAALAAGDTRKGICEKAGGNWANVIPTKGGRKEESGGRPGGGSKKEEEECDGAKEEREQHGI